MNLHFFNISNAIAKLAIVLLFFSAGATFALAQDSEQTIYMFGRDDCGFCKAEKEFLSERNLPYEYLNVVTDQDASVLFNKIAEKHGLAKVTPLTIIGERVIQGFGGSETTGKRIIAAYESEKSSPVKTPEAHLADAPIQSVTADGACDENGIECDSAGNTLYVFDVPFVGIVDFKSFSLFSLAAILGTIDGFNPCAMWVLITFLVLLTQAGSKKKMIFLAGLFIVAEAVMYNLILNVWYKTWDFVALDQYVTPFVGFLAVGGGAFFLYRWHKNKDVALVCDISNIDQQTKTIGKLKAIINQPLTITTVLAILVIAFSVNIIEFACSIGIPQAFTKILELNALTFIEQQLYILVYTIGYMVDDVIVFALAIWGFSRLEAHGHKYAQLSLLIGGTLMLLLGAILVLNPGLLVL